MMDAVIFVYVLQMHPHHKNQVRENLGNFSYFFCKIQCNIALKSTYILIPFKFLQLLSKTVSLICHPNRICSDHKGQKFVGLVNYENTFACLLSCCFMHHSDVHLQKSFSNQYLFLWAYGAMEYKHSPQLGKRWKNSRTALNKLAFHGKYFCFQSSFRLE